MEEIKIHGYRIVLYKTEVEEVKVESVVQAGFLHETKENAGVNHLLEHVLTSSWKACAPNCSAYFSDRGITMNASTDWDVMTYHVTGLPTETERMISYICSITDHPVMKSKTLTDEKKAVEDELRMFGKDPGSKLIMRFNHEFFKSGMQFKDDWELQIDNLKRLNLDDLKRTFRDEFNTGSVTFLISGKFDRQKATACFQKSLKERPVVTTPNLDCFTFSHKIVFDKFASPTYTVLLAFPSANKDSVAATIVCELFKNELFELLRTKFKLVYNFKLDYFFMPCGTFCLFEVSAQEHRVQRVVDVIFQTLKKYSTVSHFSKRGIHAVKTVYQRDVNASLPSLDTLADEVAANEALFTRGEALKRVLALTAAELKSKAGELFVADHALIAYQGSKDLKLTWPSGTFSKRKGIGGLFKKSRKWASGT